MPNGQSPLDPPPGKLRVIVTYLEMPAPPAEGPPSVPPEAGLAVRRVDRPQVPFYRHLYNTIGEDWLWSERRRLNDEQLAAIIHDPLVELHLLTRQGEPAGYAELDRRREGVVDLAYFGLFSACIGKRIGPWFLDWAVARAWAYGPSRVTVNTCTFDHPRALPLYISRGFRPVDHVVRLVTDPRLDGTMPRTCSPHIPLAG